MEELYPANKGELNGSCNRSACLAPLRKGKNFYNHSTRKHYCVRCARLINDSYTNNKMAHEWWGHKMCTLVKEEA